MKYCCKEHADYALEEILTEYEVAPVIEPLQGKKLSTATCEYCGKQAVYVVSN